MPNLRSAMGKPDGRIIARSGLFLRRGLALRRGRLARRGGAPVLRGRDADLVQEEPGEVALRREAELGRELRDLAAARREPRDRGLDAQHVEVGARGEPGADLEEIVEARARQTHLAREVVDALVLVRMRAQ